MSGIPAARVAARIRRELGVEVEEKFGNYGEFTVLVDGEPVSRGQAVATMFGVIPPGEEIVTAVREKLSSHSP